MLLEKNPRDTIQNNVPGRQLGNRKLVLLAYRLATKEPFGHLLIDLDPRCSAHLRECSKLTDSHFSAQNSRRTNFNVMKISHHWTAFKLLIDFKPVLTRFALLHLKTVFQNFHRILYITLFRKCLISKS